MNGAGQTWHTSDITPKNDKPVQAFDAALIDGSLVIAVAQQIEQSYSTISSVTLDQPKLDPHAIGENHTFHSLS